MNRRVTIGFAVVTFGIVALLSIAPIRNYDYFWHLATGRWIVENHAIPATDPFALASGDEQWVNDEWLFQAILYPLSRPAGHDGLSILLGLFVGATFAAIFVKIRRDVSVSVALLLMFIAWQGAAHRLDVRPETAAMPLLGTALVLLLRPPSPGTNLALGLLGAVWINVHPSAVLLPVLVLIVAAGRVSDRWLDARIPSRQPEAETGFEPAEILRRRGVQFVVVAVGLLINPWLHQGILAPFRLALFLESRGITNLEWLPTRPGQFPIVYLTAIAAVVFLVRASRQRRLGAELLLFLFFALLAVRFVRNHIFFFSMMPILLAPAIPLVSKKVDRMVGLASAVIAGLLLLANLPLRTGIASDTFPEHAWNRIANASLDGNIYNPDQFGGYLIWRTWPERRTLTDGRNELHADYIEEYGRARLDGREWKALLERYGLILAVEEYRSEPLEVIDAATGDRQSIPPSLAYFPRTEWALIGFDDVAMAFARRDAHPAEIIAEIEYAALVPDAFSPDQAVIGSIDLAMKELRRARRENRESWRTDRLEQLVRAAQLTRSSEAVDASVSNGHR